MKSVQITPMQSNAQQDKMMWILNEQPVVECDDYSPVYIEFLRIQYLVVDTDFTYV